MFSKLPSSSTYSQSLPKKCPSKRIAWKKPNGFLINSSLPQATSKSKIRNPQPRLSLSLYIYIHTSISHLCCLISMHKCLYQNVAHSLHVWFFQGMYNFFLFFSFCSDFFTTVMVHGANVFAKLPKLKNLYLWVYIIWQLNCQVDWKSSSFFYIFSFMKLFLYISLTITGTSEAFTPSATLLRYR